MPLCTQGWPHLQKIYKAFIINVMRNSCVGWFPAGEPAKPRGVMIRIMWVLRIVTQSLAAERQRTQRIPFLPLRPLRLCGGLFYWWRKAAASMPRA